MKIAAIFSGQFRTFDWCWPSQRKLFDPCRKAGHDVSLFFLTTDTNDGAIEQVVGKDFRSIVTVTAEPDFKDADGKYTRHGAGVRGVAPNMKQLWSLKQSFLAIPEPNKYDLIVRMRYDLEILHPGAPLFLYSRRHITVPCFCNYWGYNDRYYAAPPDMMRTCAMRLDAVNAFYKDNPWHMETHMGWTVKTNNIPVARSSVLFNLLRSDGKRDGLYAEDKWGDVPFHDSCLEVSPDDRIS